MNERGGNCLSVASPANPFGRNSSASPTARNTIAIPHLPRHPIYNKLGAEATKAARGSVNGRPAADIRPARRSGLAAPGMYQVPPWLLYISARELRVPDRRSGGGAGPGPIPLPRRVSAGGVDHRPDHFRMPDVAVGSAEL